LLRDLFKDIHLLVPAAWTAATIAGLWVVGRLISLLVAGRLAKMAKATQGEWDDAVVRAISSRIPLWSVLAGLVMAASTGIFFGVYPARKAAMLDPIVALRSE